MCGATPDDFDPYEGVSTRLTVGFIVPLDIGGARSLDNMKVICSSCFEGMKSVRIPKPDRVHLLGQIRRAKIDDQEAVLNWLLTKFGLVAQKKK